MDDFFTMVYGEEEKPEDDHYFRSIYGTSTSSLATPPPPSPPPPPPPISRLFTPLLNLHTLTRLKEAEQIEHKLATEKANTQSKRKNARRNRHTRHLRKLCDFEQFVVDWKRLQHC